MKTSSCSIPDSKMQDNHVIAKKSSFLWYSLMFAILLVSWYNTIAGTNSFNLKSSIGSSASADRLGYIRIADINGDTHKDIVASDESGAKRLYLNDGSGGFSSYSTLFTAGTIGIFEIADLDGDTDNDIVGVNNTGALKWYKNNGSGTFTEQTQNIKNGSSSINVIKLADLDNNGSIDLIWGAGGYTTTDSSEVWSNNGSGVFTYKTGISNHNLGGRSSISTGDVDGDGDLDFVTGGGSFSGFLYINNNFKFTRTQNIPGYSAYTYLIDIDKDGDLDYLAYDNHNNFGLRYRYNMGNGYFDLTETSIIVNPSGGANLTFLDYNSDGFQDFVLSNGLSHAKIYSSNGCSFTKIDSIALGNANNGFGIGDLNNDGKPDLFCAARDSASKIFLNDFNTANSPALASFTSLNGASRTGAGTVTLSITGTNYTGDIKWYDKKMGGTQLGTGSSYTTPTIYWTQEYYVELTNSNGCKTERKAVRATVTDNGSLDNFVFKSEAFSYINSFTTTAYGSSADFDNDGDIDVVTRNPNSPYNPYFFPNDGTGNFSADNYKEFTGIDFGYLVGDFNNDNYPDLFNSYTHKIWLNNGNLTFAQQTEVLKNGTGAIAVAKIVDFNKDGYKDIVWINNGSSVTDKTEIWLNDGDATFTFKANLDQSGLGERGSIDVGDIDGDGDNDIISGGGGGYGYRVYKNSPDSIYTSQTFGGYLANARFIDWDKDGDLDIVSHDNYNNAGVHLRKNNGDGTFEASTTQLLANPNPAPPIVHFADFNGDNLTDLLYNSSGWKIKVNTGCGFEDFTQFKINHATNALILNDYNNDGKIDIFAEANSGYGTTYINKLTVKTALAAPSLTVTDTVKICGPGKASLTATPGASQSINWYDAASNGTLLGTGTSYTTPSISSATTYYAEAVNANGCKSARKAVVAAIKALPDTSVSVSSGTLTANLNAVSYQWYNCGTSSIIGGKTAKTYTPGTDGSYAVIVEGANGCKDTSNCHAINTSKLNQTITFGALTSKTVGDASFTLSATASSSLSVTYESSNTSVATISGSTVTIVGAGTTTITAKQGGDATYNAAPDVTQTLTVNKQSQSITFGSLAAKTYGDDSFSLSASASSSLSVTYESSNTSVATISGSTVTIVGAGTTTITAKQAGNATYNAATDVSQTLTINKALQAINFPVPTLTFNPALNYHILGASSNSGLPVTYVSSNTAVATISTDTLKIVGAGTTNITAKQAGSSNYFAAADEVKTFNIEKASQDITFNALTSKTYGDANFTLGATSSSGLSVKYSSSDTLVAKVNGSTVTILGAGSTDITAQQDGNDNYYSASSVTQTLTVNKAAQTITFGALANKTPGDAAFTISATSSSNLTVTFESSNTAVATVSGNTVTIVGAGTTNIVAKQAGNSYYLAAADVSQALTVVAKTDQTITFGTLSTKTFGDPAFTLSATASSALGVTYESSNTAVATISGNTVTITGGGTAVITAKQAGNSTYNAAPDVTQTLTVLKKNQTINFDTIYPSTLNYVNITLSASASSGLSITYTSSDTSVAKISGNKLTSGGKSGTSIITAIQSGNSQYNAAVSITRICRIDKVYQDVTFGGPLPERTFGDGPMKLNGRIYQSDLDVVYTSSDTTVAKILNEYGTSYIQIVGVGTVNIIASHPGTDYWAPAAPVTQKFTVKGQTQTINFDYPGNKTFGDAPFTLNASASSGKPITFTSSNTAVATVSGNIATIVGAGTVSFTATQAGGGGLAPVSSLKTITVNKANQTISFGAIPSKTPTSPAFTISATSSIGQPVTFTSSNPEVATVNVTTVTILKGGTTEITATQAGTANYNAATAKQTLAVYDIEIPNFNNFSLPVYGNWNIQPIGIDPAIIGKITGNTYLTNLYLNTYIENGNVKARISAYNTYYKYYWTTLYANFYINIYDKSNQLLASKKFDFYPPITDMTGIDKNMLNGQKYTFGMVNSQYMSDLTWTELDINNNAITTPVKSNTYAYTPAIGGIKKVKCEMTFLGYKYIMIKEFNVNNVVLNVDLPDEPIIVNSYFDGKIKTDFPASYGYNPDSLVWFIDKVRFGTGKEIKLLSKKTGEVKIGIAAFYKGVAVSSEQTVTVYPKPVIDIPSVVRTSFPGNVSIPVKITNKPPYVSDVSIVLNTNEFNLKYYADTISGATTKLTSNAKHVVQLLSPKGLVIAEKEFIVKALPVTSLQKIDTIFLSDNNNYVVCNVTGIKRPYNRDGSPAVTYKWSANSGDMSIYHENQEKNYAVVYPKKTGKMTVNLQVIFKSQEQQLYDTVFISKEVMAANHYWTEHKQGPFNYLQSYSNIRFFSYSRKNSNNFTFKPVTMPSGAKFGLHVDYGFRYAEETPTLNIRPSAPAGLYKIELLNNRRVEKTIEFNIVDNRVNTTLKIVNSSNGPLKDMDIKIQLLGAFGKISNTEFLVYNNLKTDESGNAYEVVNGVRNYNLKLRPDLENRVIISKPGSVTSQKDTLFKSGQTMVLKYSNDVFELEDIKFVSTNFIVKANGDYEMSSVIMNDKLRSTGKTEIINPKSSSPELVVHGDLVYKLGFNDETINSSKTVKRYRLSNGAIVSSSDKNAWFRLDELAGMTMQGVALAFSDNRDTMSVVAFPKLPWLLGEGMDYFAGEFADDFYEAVKNKDAHPSLNLNGKAMLLGASKDLEERLQMPNVEIIKTYITGSQYSYSVWDWKLENFSYAGFGITLDKIGVIYKPSEQYFECKGFIEWGESEGKKKKRGGNVSDSLTVTNDSLYTLEEIATMVQNTIDNDSTKASTKVEFRDNNGNTLYETTYDEFTDLGTLSDNLQTRGKSKFPFSGLGIEFAIRAGIIDKLIITVGVGIKVPSLGIQISKIKGGVENLSKKDPKTNIVSYNPNFTLVAGCEITDLAGTGLVKLEDITVKVDLLSAIRGEGYLSILDYKIGKASIEFDGNKSLFLAKTNTNFFDLMRGEIGFGMGNNSQGKFDFCGSANMAITTPGWAIIPSDLRHLTLGRYDVGINTKRAAVKVKIGLASLVRSEPQRGLWDDIVGVAKAVGSAIVKTAVKVGNKVIEIAKDALSYLELEIGLGYDFENKKFLFGPNVEVPNISQFAQRGDTLEYGFNVNQDTRKVYLFVDNGGKDEVKFQIINPENRIVNSDVSIHFLEGSKTTVVTIPTPKMGIWSLKVDTTMYGSNINIQPMLINNSPSGAFVSPMTADTGRTEIALKFNDTNDTLDVNVYVDDNNEGYDGFSIKQFKVLNNASVKFTYEPVDLQPGTYYFYFMLTDRSGIPVRAYAPGTLIVKGSNSLPVPVALAYNQIGDSLLISWNRTDSSKVQLTRIKLNDLSEGKLYTTDMPSDTFIMVNDAKSGRRYSIEALNIGFDNDYSTSVRIPEFIFKSTLKNNIPTLVSSKQMLFKEGQIISHALKAFDADGDSVTFDILENLPKTMAVGDDTIMWCPALGEGGIYDFHLVLSDGKDSDTIPIKLSVENAFKPDVSIEFPSANLYEADNMFVSITDKGNDAQKINVTLINTRSRDSIVIDAHNVGENKFTGNFQLSYLRRSVIAVKNGDTILAVYRKDTSVYYNYAFFNETPQIRDHVAPGAITDLAVYEGIDSIYLNFTVPTDAMDNGILTSPWMYDIRYNYKNINGEDAYVTSLNIESYDVGERGKNQIIAIAKSDLFEYDLNAQVWFNIKSADTRFNFSGLSNTVYIIQVAAPRNVVAKQENAATINLTWSGPNYEDAKEVFDQYKIYRTINDGVLQLVDSTRLLVYNDSIRPNFEDGKVEYAVEAIFKSETTEKTPSNILYLDFFSDINVKVSYNKVTTLPLSVLNVKLIPSMKSFIELESKSNEQGQLYFERVVNGSHIVHVMLDNEVITAKNIVVSSTSKEFDIVVELKDTVKTAIENSIARKFEVSPNPSDGWFRISMLNEDLTDYAVELFTISGSKVSPNSIRKADRHTINIDLTNVGKGVYTLYLKSNEKVYTTKLVVQ